MAITYWEIDKSSWLYQPNLERSRHRYRGVRESFKFNLEINQAHFDLTYLSAKKDEVTTFLNDNTTRLYSGASIGGVEYNWYYDSEASDQPLALDGMDTMKGSIMKLRDRVRDLERKRLHV